MGWVIDREKERAKNDLIRNITSNIANVTAVSNEVHQLIANINHLIGGIPSGTDTRWLGCCQRKLRNLSQSSGLLRQGLENAKQLNTVRWVSDGD